MSRILSSKRIQGGIGPFYFDGAPSNGTSEVQTLTTSGTISGGTFTLAYAGYTTAAITWSATNSTLVTNIQTALRALANIGASDVTVTVGTATSGIGTFLITFGGNLAKKAVETITVGTKSLTGSGANVAVAETTPGVDASLRGAAKGAIGVDGTGGVLYLNGGTATVPVWKKLYPGKIVTAVVAGGSAGNFTVTGIAVADELASVIYFPISGGNVTSVSDLTSEFTITAANTINNTSGTATTSGKLIVVYRQN